MAFLLILFMAVFGLGHGLSPAELVNRQLPQGAGPYLKNRVPFLQTGQPVEEKNLYSVILQSPLDSYQTLVNMTGMDLESSDIIASWYLFEKDGQAPASLVEVLNLVNRQRPDFLGQMTLVQGEWRAEADLPHRSLVPGAKVFVYFSMINRSGILVPVGSQSFYEDLIEGRMSRHQRAGINLELVRFWHERGYFAFSPAPNPE